MNFIAQQLEPLDDKRHGKKKEWTDDNIDNAFFVTGSKFQNSNQPVNDKDSNYQSEDNHFHCKYLAFFCIIIVS